MAYNPFGADTGVEDFSGGDVSAEERKRRLASIAAMISGQNVGDIAGKMANDRLGQISDRLGQVQQTFENPEEAAKQRFGVNGPVAPATPQVQPVSGPAIPNANVPNPELGQLPQPGPGTQVAGPAVMSKEAAIQTAQTNPQITAGAIPGQGTDLNSVYHESVISARNEQDPQKRRQAYAALLSNDSVPEGYKAMAQRFISEDYLKAREQAKAEEKIANATPNDLARFMQTKGEEGSYLKAILFQRLGLTELAKEEQQKLGAGNKTGSATDATTGQRYTVERNANGEIVRAFNTEGKKAGQEEIARLSAATLPTQAHQLPSVHGSPVQNAQGETGLLMYDPQTQSSYVQVGNKRLSPTGWTTMAQNVQAVYGAAGAKQQGTQAAQTGVQQPAMPPLAGQVSVQPAAQVQPQVVPQARPGAQGQVQPQTQVVPQTQPQIQPQVQAQPIVGGAGTVTQRPGESYTSFQQRQKIAEEQAAANIQANKEVSVAERKPPAEAKGKVAAKDVNNQAFADSSYGLIKPISDEIKKSTGSGIGAGVDVLASKIGAGTEGAKAIAKLEVLAYPLLANVPRFEGPQSDYDVQTYMKAAGDFQNDKKPASVRLAALQAMVTVLKKYDKEGKNDWTFGEGKPAGSGTTSTGNKYKRVE